MSTLQAVAAGKVATSLRCCSKRSPPRAARHNARSMAVLADNSRTKPFAKELGAWRRNTIPTWLYRHPQKRRLSSIGNLLGAQGVNAAGKTTSHWIAAPGERARERLIAGVRSSDRCTAAGLGAESR